MATITGAIAGGVLSLAGGVMAAASTGHPAPDYAGIAALVASATGLVSAVGALIIGLRRRSRDVDAAIVELWLREHGDETPPPPKRGKK